MEHTHVCFDTRFKLGKRICRKIEVYAKSPNGVEHGSRKNASCFLDTVSDMWMIANLGSKQGLKLRTKLMEQK